MQGTDFTFYAVISAARRIILQRPALQQND